MTLNLGECHLPIVLFYAGERIDINASFSALYDAAYRLEITLNNPLAVVECFHMVADTVINTMLKGGMFSDLLLYYGPIEYQGRGTPHTHLVVSPLAMFPVIFADQSSMCRFGSRVQHLHSRYKRRLKACQFPS